MIVLYYNIMLKDYKVPAAICLNGFNTTVETFLRRLTEQYFKHFPRMESEIKVGFAGGMLLFDIYIIIY